jgi:TP901 family phage tail tape measure protein
VLADTAKLTVDLGLNDHFSGGLAAASRSLKGFDTQVGKLTSKIGKDLSNGLGQAIKNTEKLGLAVGGLALGAGVAAVKWAGDFQAQLNTINTIAFATPEALNKIGDGIRGIAKQTGLSLDDLTSSYYDLLSAGIKVADAQSVLNNAVTLGIGGLATTAQTVDLLTTAYNAYGLDAAGATKATDMFAQAVADGKVKADQIAETFANVASIAKAYGIGINQIAASYGFLTAQGVPAAEVTTEMNRAIISLIKPLPALAKAQKDLKINFTDEIRTKGLIPALQELRDYSDKTKIPLIELLGRVEAVKYVLQTTGPQEAGFLAELARINSSSGEAAKQAAERQQGFNYELGKFQAAVKDAGITIGTVLLPKLTPMVEQLSKFINSNHDGIAGFGQKISAALSEVVGWVKKLDFRAIADDFRIAGDAAKSIVNAFLDAPPWLQQFLTVGFVANKFTGGAVQAIIGDLASGLIKGILGITAGVVNITAGVVNGGGGGLPNVSPAIGTIGAGATALTVAGLAAAVAVIAAPIVIEATHKPGDPTVGGGRLGFYPGVHSLIPGTAYAAQDTQHSNMGGILGNLPFQGSTGMFDTGSERAMVGMALRQSQRDLVAAYDAMVAATRKTAHELATLGVGGSGKTFHDFLLNFRKTGQGFGAEFKYLQTANPEGAAFPKSVAQDIAAQKRLLQQAQNRGDTKTAATIAGHIAKLEGLLKGTLTVKEPGMPGWAAALRAAFTVNVTTTVTANSGSKTTTHVSSFGTGRRYGSVGPGQIL